jgi:tRNA threonylcarbamoyladenosine biosynthesis protein TsaB
MQPPRILAIESSTSTCSAAVMCSRGSWQLQEDLQERHSETLLPLIETLLQQSGQLRHDLTHVAAGIGPGSFTGVRTAVSTAQGIALALGLPLVGVSSLQALAWSAQLAPAQRVLTVLDARMQEVYAAVYEFDAAGGELVCLKKPAVVPPAELAVWSSLNIDCLIGNALSVYPAELEVFADRARHAVPQAQHVAELALQQIARGKVGQAASCQPVYVRNRVAATVQERQQLGHRV